MHDLVTNGEISYKELYEANNYLAIAEKADKYYYKKKNDNYQNRDFDFFIDSTIMQVKSVMRKCRNCGQKFWQGRLISQESIH